MSRVNLFSALTLKSVTLRNRMGVSPMCMYSSKDGFASDFHLVHLGARAIGGAGLVIMEASSVERIGGITANDNGIYKDEHVPMLKKITTFIKSQGTVPGIQIAHAGRKGNTAVPWLGSATIPATDPDYYETVAPSPIAFGGKITHIPRELTKDGIKRIVSLFADAARRALEAGFELLEIHGAHGYLIHSFYSPLSNKRTDEYGGSFENRTRLLVEIVEAVKKVWPETLPLGVRLSCSDWTEDGWNIDDSVKLSKKLKELGVDFIDCSSMGNTVDTSMIPFGPSYQVPFADRIKKEAGITTFAVGGLTEAAQSDEVIRNNRADVVLFATHELNDPHFPYHAAQKLSPHGITANSLLPQQYHRAK